MNIDRGDEAIVEGYDVYQEHNWKDLFPFGNDRDFVEGTRSHRVLVQGVKVTWLLWRKTEASCDDIFATLYTLTVCFGVLDLPKVTLYDV